MIEMAKTSSDYIEVGASLCSLIDRLMNDGTPHDRNVVNEDNITHSLAMKINALKFQSSVTL